MRRHIFLGEKLAHVIIREMHCHFLRSTFLVLYVAYKRREQYCIEYQVYVNILLNKDFRYGAMFSEKKSWAVALSGRCRVIFKVKIFVFSTPLIILLGII